ncbi:hypothetical protein pb186bvf_019849 [Paramecium bursaria]
MLKIVNYDFNYKDQLKWYIDENVIVITQSVRQKKFQNQTSQEFSIIS